MFRFINNYTVKFLLGIFIVASIASCGGSGGDSGGGSNATVSANGLWEGTFTENGVGTFDVSGLLYNGRIIAISELAGVIYDGSYTVSGNNISANVTAYQIGGSVFATSTISGTVSEENSIATTFNTSYGTSGSMSLSFNNIYNRSSSLSLIAGSWNYTSGSYSLTITAQNDGSFFGQDSDGCVLNGNITIIDATHNLYNTSVSVTLCGVLNGTYTGFSGLLDNITTNDTLQVAVSNSNYILLYPFTRQ